VFDCCDGMPMCCRTIFVAVDTISKLIFLSAVSGFPNSCNSSMRLNLTGIGEYPGGFLG